MTGDTRSNKTRMDWKKRINVISLTLIILFLYTSPSSAGLGVVGALFMTSANPGDHISHEIKVSIKDTDSPMDLNAEVGGFGESIQGSYLVLNEEEDTSPYSAREFLTISPSSFHLEPGESETLKIEGDIPENAEGGRYALAYIHSLPAGEGKIGVAVGVKVPVLIMVAGTNQTKTGEIEMLDMVEPISSESPKTLMIFNNTGNYYYKALAEVTLKDINGNQIANSTSLSSSSLIPTYSWQFELPFELDEDLGPGTYEVKATVSLEDGTVLDTEEAEFEI